MSYVAKCSVCGLTVFRSYEEPPTRADVERIEKHERGHHEERLPVTEASEREAEAA